MLGAAVLMVMESSGYFGVAAAGCHDADVHEADDDDDDDDDDDVVVVCDVRMSVPPFQQMYGRNRPLFVFLKQNP